MGCDLIVFPASRLASLQIPFYDTDHSTLVPTAISSMSSSHRNIKEEAQDDDDDVDELDGEYSSRLGKA